MDDHEDRAHVLTEDLRKMTPCRNHTVVEDQQIYQSTVPNMTCERTDVFQDQLTNHKSHKHTVISKLDENFKK